LQLRWWLECCVVAVEGYKLYKGKRIVTLAEEERTFNKITSAAFNIPEMCCASITDTRSKIREHILGLFEGFFHAQDTLSKEQGS